MPEASAIMSSETSANPPAQAPTTSSIRLRVSCSFDSDLVASRQRGLWPTCPAARPACSPPPATADEREGAQRRSNAASRPDPSSLLLAKCPLPWRHCPPDHRSPGPDAMPLGAAAHLGPVRLGRDGPAGGRPGSASPESGGGGKAGA
jgi:hypothetical protein